MVRKWKNISIPEKMYDKISELIEKEEIKKKCGYGSVSEFVRDALRLHIKDLDSTSD